MAHFAQLDQNNTVVNVVVVDNNDILDENGNESEQLGIEFLNNLFKTNEIYKQTSYNNNFRVRYAVIGGFYSEEHDAFVHPKPEFIPDVDSNDNPLPPGNYEWQLNETTLDWDLVNTDS
jgi:predicted component of viral defense system (DUF524 family)